MAGIPLPKGWELDSQAAAPRRSSGLGFYDPDAARDFGSRWGTVTSMDRTPEHNRRVGGVGNSWHLTTRGARGMDIARRSGVTHAQIVEDARARGFDLIEDLDEGDHSHLAFRQGPTREDLRLAYGEVPDGWEVVGPDEPPQGGAAALAGFAPGAALPLPAQRAPAAPSEADKPIDAFRRQLGIFASDPALNPEQRFGKLREFVGSSGINIGEDDLRTIAGAGVATIDLKPGALGEPWRAVPISVANAPEAIGTRAQSVRTIAVPDKGPSLYRGMVDPESAGRLQSLFDAGASLDELVAEGNRLGVQFERGNLASLRQAVSFRDKGGKGARLLPERAPPPENEPTLKPGPEWDDMTLAEKAGQVSGDIARELGFGKQASSRLGRRIEGAAEIIPFVGGKSAIDEGFRDIGRGDVGSGATNIVLGGLDFIPAVGPVGRAVGRAGKTIIEAGDTAIDALRAADQALAAGGTVTVRVGDRVIPITKPGLVDDTGQAWREAMASRPEGGDVPRLEINAPDVPAGRAVDRIEAGTPPRVVDRIDVQAGPRAVDRIEVTVPKGWQLVGEGPLGRPRPPAGKITPEELAAGARGMEPGDIVPVPRNAVDSLDEFNAIGDSRPVLEAPAPARELSMRRIGTTASGRAINRRGPPDLVTWIRTQPWGVRDDAGELAFMGVSNKARKGLDFTGGEGFLGRIIDKEAGVSLDEAALRAWEAGYFPEHPTRPSVNEFLEKLGDTYSGRNRAYRPEDYEEVERFGAAREQLAMIEAAKQEGVPLADDIGQPITLDDLKANEPEAYAYEDLPALTDKVGNINLANVRNAGDISRALKNIEAQLGPMRSSGVRTHAETQALAAEMGMTVEELLSTRRGRAFSAEEALAARATLANVMRDLVQLARQAQTGGDAAKAEFGRALSVAAAVYNKVADLTAEAGRALSAFRIPADAKMIPGSAIADIMRTTGMGERLEEIAKRVLDLEQQGVSPGGIAKFAQKAAKARTIDKVLEYYYASMLSAPTTHAINIAGNSAAMGLSVPEFALASVLGSLRLKSADRITAQELGGYLAGMVTGVKNGLKAARRTFITGSTLDPVTRIDTRHAEAIGGRLGYAVRTPLRALAAEDELFKGIARQGALGRLAIKQARREGLKGDAIARRADELLQNPTEDMMTQAIHFARYMTFQQPLGPIGQAVLVATNKAPALKFFIPFVQTLGNLVKFSAARSPVGLIMPSVWKDLKAGGELRDLAIARMAVGSTIGVLAYQAALQGLITGGEPLDTSTRNLLKETGWQPYSVKVGDRYISFRQFDPISLTMSVAADFATYDRYMTQRERERGAQLLGQIISRNIQDSFYLQSLSELLEMIEDPVKQVPGRFGQIAGTLAVPNIIAQPLASWDSVERDQRPDPEVRWYEQSLQSFVNRIKARVPGLRDNLPARKNAWGEDVPNDGRLGPDIISPLKQRLIRSQPVSEAMIQNDLRVGYAGKTINGVPVPARERARLNKLAGEYIKTDLAEIMATQEWQEASGAERYEWFGQIKRDAREDAKADLGLDTWGMDEGGELPESSNPESFDEPTADVGVAVPKGWEVAG